MFFPIYKIKCGSKEETEAGDRAGKIKFETTV